MSRLTNKKALISSNRLAIQIFLLLSCLLLLMPDYAFSDADLDIELPTLSPTVATAGIDALTCILPIYNNGPDASGTFSLTATLSSNPPNVSPHIQSSTGSGMCSGTGMGGLQIEFNNCSLASGEAGLVQFTTFPPEKGGVIITVNAELTHDPSVADPVGSNDTWQGFSQVNGPYIDLNPSNFYNMGYTPVGSSTTLEVIITNLGNTNLVITSIIYNSGSSDMTMNLNGGSDPCGSSSLTLTPLGGANDSCTVTVIFAPQSEHVYSSLLQIESNDAGDPLTLLDINATSLSHGSGNGGGGGCFIDTVACGPRM